MASVVLIGGGARSGKSELARQMALRLGDRRVFLATGAAGDAEMAERIARHQADRGDEFRTVEEPLALPDALCALRDVDVVLVDCLTLWLSNLLIAEHPDPEAEVRRLVAALDGLPFHTLLVSNEVGLGIVPMHPLARRFRDVAGRAHQTIAARADAVYGGLLGLMLRLAPGPVEAVLDPAAEAQALLQRRA